MQGAARPFEYFLGILEHLKNGMPTILTWIPWNIFQVPNIKWYSREWQRSGSQNA